MEQPVTKRKFSAGQFEGPLDLLLSLIRENQINIYDIPIGDITEQFLDYLDYAVETDLQDLSEFYSWAAKLALIKSRMLLPVDVAYDDDNESMEDPRTELVEQLIQYQRFKKLSELLEEQEEQSEWSFERKKIERILPFEEDESQWEQVDAWELLQDMQKIIRSLTKAPEERILDMSEEISPEEKIELMKTLLHEHGECMFTDLITRHGNELDVICAFMAILEAVKRKIADIYQNRMFGDIKICKKKQAA